MRLIDSHCHLDFAAFRHDHKSVIHSAQCAGITHFVVPGVQALQWQSLIDFCQNNPSCHYALGIHPYFLTDYDPRHIEQLEEKIKHAAPIAIGECGLDSSIGNLPLQQEVFQHHIRLANQFAKPLIVHHRKSHHLILAAFKSQPPRYGGVVHAFTGSIQDAQKYVALGFKLGVGGSITYDRAQKTKNALRQLPLSAMVLETDSPDMPLSGQQGLRNEPQNIVKIAQNLADLMDLPLAQVAEQTTVNTQQVFGI